VASSCTAGAIAQIATTGHQKRRNDVGGINVGQGEFPPAYTQGGGTITESGSCQSTAYVNATVPSCRSAST